MVVTMEYTLLNPEGEVLDSTEGKAPLSYLHGASNIIAGLEDELEGLQQGDAFEVVVPFAKGYGPIQKRLFNEIPRSRFPEDAKLEVGERFFMNGANGRTSVRVVSIQDDQVTIDANHGLAGVDLHFKGSIVGIREGSSQELNAGEVAPQTPHP